MLIFLHYHLEVLGERKGHKIGTLRCLGLKPPVVRGHEAAFRYWFERFGHSGPYRETIIRNEEEEIKEVIPSGNPMDDPGMKSPTN